MSVIGDSGFKGYEGAVPSEIRKGVFGATFKNKDGEPLFLRMELITKENEKGWTRFRNITAQIANPDTGILSGLVSKAGEDSYPKYEAMKKFTGFTNEEYNSFTQEAIERKKTTSKIVDLLKSNSIGSRFMQIVFDPEQPRYIVYVSKNPHFSILEADKKSEEKNLKKYIDAYSDILIAVGSDFSQKESFHNRGIFKNPYWVFKDKYPGLSMKVLAFTGAVADKFFPEKKIMEVVPVGSMQVLIKDKLLPEEGYVVQNVELGGEKLDITHLEVSKMNPEGLRNYIKTSALTRIYNQTIG